MGTQKVIVVGTTKVEADHKIINTTGLTDPDLSWKAKGMHAYIRTNAGGWISNQEGLVGTSTDGRDAVRAGIQELVERKYLHRATVRNEQGRIVYHAYISTPTPVDLSDEQITALAKGEHVALPETGLPRPGNPHVVGSDGNYHYPSGNSNYLYTNKLNNPSGYQVVLGAAGRTRQNIMEFWNALPNTPTHKLNHKTKTLTKNDKALAKALKSHSPMVIKDAMQAYNDLLGAPYTTLTNVATKASPVRVPLYEFFQFDYKSMEIVGKPNHPLHGKVDTWFKTCRQGKDHVIDLFAALRKDKHPKVTARLTAMWDNLVGITNSPREKNALRQAAEKIMDFLEQNKNRFYDIRLATPPMAINRLEQLLATKDAAALHIGWLYSEITWAELEKYLVEQTVIKERRKPERRANG